MCRFLRDFRYCFALFLVFAGLSSTLVQADPLTPTFMPQPATVALKKATLALSGLPRTVWATSPSPLLKRALSRFNARLRLAGVPLDRAHAPELKIMVGRDPAYLTLASREAYTLDISSDRIVLLAEGPAGVIHGFATLLQMIDTHGPIPRVLQGHISDAPRFKWRGLMLDVSRHFQSVDTIKRQLDAMELTKLNVMHWHLSDGAGFRIESRRLPRLQEKGGHGQYYTQAQIREIVSYAADRGIRIVPEIDVPGHALAILAAYPALAAQQPVPIPQEWQQGCQNAPNTRGTNSLCSRHTDFNTPALDPTSPAVLKFVGTLFSEMAGLFPDQYFHTGGDEVVARQWNDNPRIVAYMKAHGYKDVRAMQAAFTAEIEKILVARNKIMMGWDEVSEAPIPKNVVVEAWRGSKWVGTATKRGHPVVVSSGYYLDLLNPSAKYYAVDPYDTRADGLAPNLPGAPLRTLDDAFVLDPEAPPLDEAQKALVLGGEAPLWTEVVSDEMVDARLWPRTAAIAERYWSPLSFTKLASPTHRLPAMLNMLETFGLRASDHQARMIARLTPADILPLTRLVALTVPVRNYAINRLIKSRGEDILISPMAIAAPDSFEAEAFNDMAKRYESGEHVLSAALRQKLTRYADNDEAFKSLPGPASVNEVKPISRQIAALSRIGLEALQPVRRSKAWCAGAKALLAEQDAAFAASADHESSKHAEQPAGGLLIAILPGIKALVSTVPCN